MYSAKFPITKKIAEINIDKSGPKDSKLDITVSYGDNSQIKRTIKAKNGSSVLMFKNENELIIGTSDGLPDTNFENTMLYKVENEKEVRCEICLAHFREGRLVRILPCLHLFHKTCVDSFLRSFPECPTCKINVRKVAETSQFKKFKV